MICLPFSSTALIHMGVMSYGYCSVSSCNGVSNLKSPHFLENQTPLALAVRCISSNQESPVVSYLMDSCGLSPEKALPASKRVNFENPQRPDSVLRFFRSHGFSDKQISVIIEKLPNLLQSRDPQKTYFPKLDFFYSKGLSKAETAELITILPYILRRDLENSIIHSYNLMSEFVGSEAKTNLIIKLYPRMLYDGVDKNFLPNLKYLLDIGVPKSRVLYMLTRVPRTLSVSWEKFKVVVEEVREIGFEPTKRNFILAFLVIVSLSKDTMERKLNIYKRWGWSEQETATAFRKFPYLVIQSEDKINAAMDYFVNQVGWKNSDISAYPLVIGLSLKKRIIPRCTVIQTLWSRGLLKRDAKPSSILVPSEKVFLDRYVSCYTHDAAFLLQLYEETKDSANAIK